MLLKNTLIIVGERRREIQVEVKSGLVWATREGDPEDHFIEAGGNMKLKGKSWVLQGLRDSELEFTQ